MSLFKSSKGKDGASYVAIFDIGSGSVAAALVKFENKKTPNIIWSTRLPLTLKETTDFDRLTKIMLSTLLDVALKLQTEAVPHISGGKKNNKLDDVMFVFASPWYVMRSKIFRVKPKEGSDMVTITKQFTRNLIEKEKQNFTKSINARTSSVKQKKESPVIIEQNIVQTLLNGYQVTDPYCKAVVDAQLDLVLTAMPSPVFEKSVDISKQLLNREGGMLNSFILLSFLVTRDLFNEVNNFILVDINAEITDITTVRKGTIVGTTSFPKGKHFIIREVAKSLGTMPEEAASLLRAYFEGDSNDEYSQKIKAALKDIQANWLKEFQDSLEKISEETPLPRNIYLTTDNSYINLFEKTMNSGDYREISFTNKPFKITLLDSKLLGKYCTHNRLMAGLDPFIALSALYYNKVHYDE